MYNPLLLLSKRLIMEACCGFEIYSVLVSLEGSHSCRHINVSITELLDERRRFPAVDIETIRIWKFDPITNFW